MTHGRFRSEAPFPRYLRLSQSLSQCGVSEKRKQYKKEAGHQSVRLLHRVIERFFYKKYAEIIIIL